MSHFTRRTTVGGGIAIVAVLALVGIGTSLALGGDPSAEERDRARAVGSAYRSAPSTAAFAVNGSPVTAADLQAEVQTVNSNIEFMKSVIQEGGDAADAVATRLEIIEEAGAPNVGLAATILREALFRTAQERGLSVTDDAVQQEVDQTKRLSDQGDAPSIAGSAEAVGNTYWDEVLPKRIRRVRTVDRLYTETVIGTKDAKEAALKWISVQRTAMSETNISNLEPSVLQGATIDGARAYLEAYWTVLADE